MALACVLLLTAGCTGTRIPGTSSAPTPTSTTPPAPASSSVVELPSQTPAEAARDGVVPAIAALPMNQRIQVVASAPAVEGVWVASRPPDSTVASAPAGVLGDPTGRYGETWVQAAEYGEVLLLNSTWTSILRAYPLPGVPPRRLLVTDDAVYAERQGDGGLSVSMLCRVDRGTLAAVIRLFPTPLEPVSRQYVLPTWWVNTPIDKILFEAIKAYGPEVWVSGTDGEAQVQLPTLALSTIVAADPAKRALADRVRGYLQTNPTFTASLTGAFPAGRVLCGVQLWGSSTAKRAIYAEVVCGNYGAVNGVATEISGMGTPVLLTTAGPPATSAITGFKVPGNDEQSARDVRAWFPPLIADGILFGVGHPDLTEADLLAEAQTLLANGQLPVSTPAP